MTTLETLWDEFLELRRRVALIEQRQMRFMKQWIATSLTSPTSGPTGPTGPGSTATSAASLTMAPASTRRSVGSLLRLARTHLPKMTGWAVEQLVKYLWPVVVSVAVASWAIIKKYGEQLWAWAAGWWHWLLP